MRRLDNGQLPQRSFSTSSEPSCSHTRRLRLGSRKTLSGKSWPPSGTPGSSFHWMLPKLPIHEITRLKRSGICHAALNEQIPPEDKPVIAQLYASFRML